MVSIGESNSKRGHGVLLTSVKKKSLAKVGKREKREKMGQAGSVPEKTEKRKQGATGSDDRSPDATQNPQNQETQQARDPGEDDVRAARDAIREVKHEMLEELKQARQAGMASSQDIGQSPAFGMFQSLNQNSERTIRRANRLLNTNLSESTPIVGGRKRQSPGRKSTQVKDNGSKEENQDDGTGKEGAVQKGQPRARSADGRPKSFAKQAGDNETPPIPIGCLLKELSHDFFTDMVKSFFGVFRVPINADWAMKVSFVFHLLFSTLFSYLLYVKFIEDQPNEKGQQWHAKHVTTVLTPAIFIPTVGIRVLFLSKYKEALKLCALVGMLVMIFIPVIYFCVPGEKPVPIPGKDQNASNQELGSQNDSGNIVLPKFESKETQQQAQFILRLIENLLQSSLIRDDGFVLSLFCDISYNLNNKNFDSKVLSVCKALDLPAIAIQLVESFGKTSRVMLRLLTSSKLKEMIGHVPFEKVGGLQTSRKIKLTGFSIGDFNRYDFTLIIPNNTFDQFEKVTHFISYLNLEKNKAKLRPNLVNLEEKMKTWKTDTPTGIAYTILSIMFPKIVTNSETARLILNGHASESTAGSDVNLIAIIKYMNNNKLDAVIAEQDQKAYHDANIALVENLGTNWGKIHKNKKTRSTI